MTAPLPVSFWLLPAATDDAWLSALVDALAAARGTPAFAPHVTLQFGEIDTEPGALSALHDVAGRFAPRTLPAGPTDHGPDRFKALFLRLPTGPLAPLGQALRAFAPDHGRYRLDAHLSLLYGELPAADRALLASQHDHAGRTIRFDRIAAVGPGPDGFDDVAGWRTLGIAALRGTR